MRARLGGGCSGRGSRGRLGSGRGQGRGGEDGLAALDALDAGSGAKVKVTRRI